MRLKASLAIAVLSVAALFGACSEDGGQTPGPDAGKDAVDELRQDANEIPCGPRIVLQSICQQCHTRPTRNGAPFSLVNRSDILAATRGSVIRQLMIEQLEARRMPLSPVTITDDQRNTLLGWLKEGAPAVSPQDCPSDAGLGADGDVDAGDGGVVDDASSDGSENDAPPE
jgi:hypothetical protein